MAKKSKKSNTKKENIKKPTPATENIEENIEEVEEIN